MKLGQHDLITRVERVPLSVLDQRELRQRLRVLGELEELTLLGEKVDRLRRLLVARLEQVPGRN